MNRGNKLMVYYIYDNRKNYCISEDRKEKSGLCTREGYGKKTNTSNV